MTDSSPVTPLGGLVVATLAVLLRDRVPLQTNALIGESPRLVPIVHPRLHMMPLPRASSHQS
jgi:hypothetical protein